MRKCEEGLGRKRKVGLEEESELSSTTSSVQLKTRRLSTVVTTPENSDNSTCESVCSDRGWASCCSTNGSSDLAKKNPKILDLKDEEEEVSGEFSPTTAGESVNSRNNRREEEETTPSSEVQADSGEFELSVIRPKHDKSFRCPSEAELEEFFATAEMNIQKQFTDKYNYDIVKDEPLEGRYEWVRI